MWKIHLREVNGCAQVLSSPTLPRAGEDFVEDTACPQPGPGVLVSKAAPRSPENVPKLGAGSAASYLGSGCTRPLSVSRRTGTWAKARLQPLVPGSRLGSVHAGRVHSPAAFHRSPWPRFPVCKSRVSLAPQAWTQPLMTF